jgi:hypothetical protein
MDASVAMLGSTDHLAERVVIIAYYTRAGIACNARQTV